MTVSTTTTTTNIDELKPEVIQLLQTLNQWSHIEPEGLALLKLCQFLLESDDHLVQLSSAATNVDLVILFHDTNTSIETFIQQDQQGQDLWGIMLWKTRRDILLSQFRLTWQSLLFDQFNPWMTHIHRPFPFYTDIQAFEKDMIDQHSYQYYQLVFGSSSVVTWKTFMERYTAQFGPWDTTTHDCLKYLMCHLDHGRDMSVYSYITMTREYGFPLDMEKLPLTMLSPPPAPSENARVETAKMVMDLITEFSTKTMRDHLVTLYAWFQGLNKRDKVQMQDRANEWAQVTLKSRTKINLEDWTEEEKHAERVDLARRTISLFYQRYMVMWRMGQFARDLFADVDFPGKGRIFEMKEQVLPLDHANFHLIIKGDPSKWHSKRPKVYKFLDQVVKQT